MYNSEHVQRYTYSKSMNNELMNLLCAFRPFIEFTELKWKLSEWWLVRKKLNNLLWAVGVRLWENVTQYYMYMRSLLRNKHTHTHRHATKSIHSNSIWNEIYYYVLLLWTFVRWSDYWNRGKKLRFYCKRNKQFHSYHMYTAIVL